MNEDLLALWRVEEREQPTGWSFEDLAGRMSTDPMPWDFRRMCAEALTQAGSALDMGTGGGETLLELCDAVVARGGHLPTMLAATEGWPPNVPVARAALAPFGIDVVEFGQPDDDSSPAPMPFASGAFDLVLNRHESYHPAEIARLLAPGGTFLTQQVGGDELAELHELLDFPHAAPHVIYERFRDELRDGGLELIGGGELVGSYTFTDVAAVVAYLQRVPWDVPQDFTVDRYAEQLLELHRRSGGGPVRLTMKRFWLRARRPG